MARSSHGVPSLRIWLQSSSLLAVVAGYSLLLLIHQHLATWQRNQAFRQTNERLLASLVTRANSVETLQAELLREQSMPDLNLSLVDFAPARKSDVPDLIDQGTSKWLVGSAAVDLEDGSRVQLEVKQDVTASVQQERLGFWLLVIAAGGSTMVTSVLLRLVLQRGLVHPLQDFRNELTRFKAPPNRNDVIDLKQHPQELQPIAEAFNALQRRLVHSWNRERAFADGVAHELRTPITLISGHSQRLLRQSGLPDQTDSLKLIYRESERMRSLVSDLLDVARCDSGRLTLKREAIVVEDALLELFERLEGTASGRLQLSAMENNASPVVEGDPERLQQCLTALVDNGLLYSTGRIQLGWSQPTPSQVRLHVRDQGPGVEPQERERIFERFVRGSAGQRSPNRGSGIGLSIVRLLMELMGGQVAVAEAPGGGADFQLQLPVFTASDLQV